MYIPFGRLGYINYNISNKTKMPVYILRHEERHPQNPLFESSLTAQGMCNAVRLVGALQALHIDTIYASPFLRVMQTIYPYCKAMEQKACIDHSLYECMDNLLFTEYNRSFTWCDLPPRYHQIVHKQYSPMYTHVQLYETFEQVCERVRPFVEVLKQKYTDSPHSVLLATHLTTANAIRHVIDATASCNDVLAMGSIVRVM